MLTENKARAALAKGGKFKIPDGRSLFLWGRGGRVAYWVYHYRDGKSQRSKSLGVFPEISPAEARARRDEYATALRNPDMAERLGVTPTRAHARKNVVRFEAARDAFLKQKKDFRMWTDKTWMRNRNLLIKYCTRLDRMPLDIVTTEDVVECLRPIWTGRGDNKGDQLRGLIESVFNGHVAVNPATADRVLLPMHGLNPNRVEGENRPSMPHKELPEFFASLDMNNVLDRATAFIILTGVRPGEALGKKRNGVFLPAIWAEIDLPNRVWWIPGERMKPHTEKGKTYEGKDHLVPLTDAAIAMLGTPNKPDEMLFSIPDTGRPLRDDDLSLSKRFGLSYDLSGFRASFETWAEEQDDGRKYSSRVLAAALAHRKKSDEGHALGSQDLAYRRSTFFDQRIPLMDDWAWFATTGQQPQKAGE